MGAGSVRVTCRDLGQCQEPGRVSLLFLISERFSLFLNLALSFQVFSSVFFLIAMCLDRGNTLEVRLLRCLDWKCPVPSQ